MTILQRTFSFLALLLGLAGTLGCLAMVVGSWFVGAKLNTMTERLFGHVDDTLSAIRERVPPMLERFDATKVTVGEIEQSFKQWARHEVGQQLPERLKLSERTTASQCVG